IQLQTLGRKFGYFNGYQVCNGPTCLYATSGTTDDYAYGKLGVASYTFELGQNFFEQCSFFTSNIIPKNMPALYYAFKAARRPYQNPLGPDVLSVAVSPAAVTAGTPVNLSATLNDTRYSSNGWGTEPTQTVQAGRYSIDTPSWKGATLYPLTAADGAFNAGVENVVASISTTGLSAGRHTIFVEGQDASGNWGVPAAVFLTVN
ncbi:MAG: peptidase M14, partial [Chloroflexota bacterium]|nr:peptidase M14 [Chloroflexota bacterium]